MKTAILSMLLSTAALAQTCDYYPLTTCAQNVLGRKTFLDGIAVPGGIVTDGGTSTGNLTVNGDAGVSGNVSIAGNLSGADAGFNSVTSGGAVVATKILWSTPDVIQDNSGGTSNTRILVGPLSGISGSISSVNCQPQERGDGGGRLYVTLAEVTDGGYTSLCAMDFDSCDLSDITANQLGLLTLSRGGCAQSLSASKVYMYSFGQPDDGGSKCGLHTPVTNCTTVIQP